jgi:hypothetical protein
MTKSATDVMHEIIYSAVLDSIASLKAASKGLPNTLLRDLNAIHANTTFADLPAELQSAITASVRAAFTRLLKEGYSVSNAPPPPQRAAAIPRREPMRDRKPTGNRSGERPPGGNRSGERPPGGNRTPDNRTRGPKPPPKPRRP